MSKYVTPDATTAAFIFSACDNSLPPALSSCSCNVSAKLALYVNAYVAMCTPDPKILATGCGTNFSTLPIAKPIIGTIVFIELSAAFSDHHDTGDSDSSNLSGYLDSNPNKAFSCSCAKASMPGVSTPSMSPIAPAPSPCIPRYIGVAA